LYHGVGSSYFAEECRFDVPRKLELHSRIELEFKKGRSTSSRSLTT
jgi:hypothetical protein